MPLPPVPPSFRERSFTCPHCHTLSAQNWGELGRWDDEGELGPDPALNFWAISTCQACERVALWDGTGKEMVEGFVDPRDAASSGVRVAGKVMFPTQVWRMVYPADSPVGPEPNPDMPDDIHKLYVEAQEIAIRSPRSAAALLRLCVQMLCKHLGQPGNNINADIGALVQEQKLRPHISKAMDTVRIVGNEGVHPGELVLDDEPELVEALFVFVNLITDEAITQPRMVEVMFDKVPESKRAAIEDRDRR
jgi:hypothetical protein